VTLPGFTQSLADGSADQRFCLRSDDLNWRIKTASCFFNIPSTPLASIALICGLKWMCV
jgi:hypothetical protein